MGWNSNGPRSKRVYRSTLPQPGTLTLSSDVAYWIYCGIAEDDLTTARIRYFVAVVADSGTQTAEVAIASTPLGPCGAAQVLTKLGAASMLGLTVLKNGNTPLAVSIPKGTHVWIGTRSAHATTRPTFRGLGYDYGDGSLLKTNTAGALTGSGPWTGAVVADATTATAPDLSICLD